MLLNAMPKVLWHFGTLVHYSCEATIFTIVILLLTVPQLWRNFSLKGVCVYALTLKKFLAPSVRFTRGGGGGDIPSHLGRFLLLYAELPTRPDSVDWKERRRLPKRNFLSN